MRQYDKDMIVPIRGRYARLVAQYAVGAALLALTAWSAIVVKEATVPTPLVETARPLPINTDGEVTTRTPARVVVVPKAIAVHVPETFLASLGANHAAG